MHRPTLIKPSPRNVKIVPTPLVFRTFWLYLIFTFDCSAYTLG